MNQYVIIVAGGSGQRMQTTTPKQFLELAGKPVLMHTINQFVRYNPEIQIIVVLPNPYITAWEDLTQKYNYLVKHRVVPGGDVRFRSVKNGLDAIPEDGIVAIHDGVRPFVSIETIRACFTDALKYGNAIPCIPIYDTVRQISDNTSVLMDRSHLRLIQTPQVFKISLIKKAYTQPCLPEFTDDASVVERIGVDIHLVEGNRENIKITDPLDMLIANTFINSIK